MTNIADINYLFRELYPLMAFADTHRESCIRNLHMINEEFNHFNENFNGLLGSLMSLSGIGVVVGTGLIHCTYRDIAVPFDKYTLSYCIEQGILQSHRVSANYTDANSKVIQHIRTNFSNYSIRDFVEMAATRSGGNYDPE